MLSRNITATRQTVLLSLSATPSEKELRSSLAAYAALRLAGKSTEIRGGKELPSVSLLRQSGSDSFVVSLKGLAPWISSVSYEKGDRDLRLIFTLNRGTFSPEHLSLEREEGAGLTIIVEDEEVRHNNALQEPFSDSSRALSAALGMLPPEQRDVARAAGDILASLQALSPSSFFAIFPADAQKLVPSAPEALRNILQWTRGECSFAVLLPSASESPAQCLFMSESPALRKALAAEFQGEEKESWVLFRIPAEESHRIRSFLSNSNHGA